MKGSPEPDSKDIMSSRSRVFVSSEIVPGYNAVTLRRYLGGEVTVKKAADYRV